MFERNPVDNSAPASVVVEITLDDQTVLTGKATIPHARAVHKLMDGSEPFLYVDVTGGDATFVPKASIKALKILTPTRTQSLPSAQIDSSFDPHRALGLSKSASFEEVKTAYHRLTKMYHPDVFAAVTLPPEVAAYLDGRAKQINSAFRMLKGARPVAKFGT
jgi:DnaJ-domain-containing protein 1